jgi:capsular polysaccharide biosynthesis protein
MELRNLLKNLHRKIKYIIFAGLVLGVLGFVLSSSVPDSYTARMTLYVQKNSEFIEGEYTYDGYYAQQAVEAYTDTVKGLIEQPEVLSEVLLNMGIANDRVFDEYYKYLDVKKVAPQLVAVEITRRDAQEAGRMVSEISNVVTRRIEALNETRQDRFQLVGVDEDPIISRNELPILLISIVSVFLGLLFGSFIFAMEWYIREEAQ